ncbi:hypothetical protein FAM22280_00594 [Lacticaseibacillus paracasei]|nr:hypothetical protein FAM22280_00594 [Lacticaseibacillus paracasei]
MSVDKGWIADYPYNTSRDRYTSHHAWQFRSDQQFAGSYGNFDVSQLYDVSLLRIRHLARQHL